MPQQNGAISRSGSDVTIGSDVTLGPGQTRDHPVMSKHYLNDFGGLCGEDAETVVPEPAGDQELRVHSGDEAVGPNFQVLAKVVPQVTSLHLILLITVVCQSWNQNHPIYKPQISNY